MLQIGLELNKTEARADLDYSQRLTKSISAFTQAYVGSDYHSLDYGVLGGLRVRF